MAAYIHIPFPQDLYDKIVLRSNGRIDPCRLAVDQVEQFIDRTMFDADIWTEEGIELFEEEEETSDIAQFGPPDRGYQWQRLLLPNGAELRMTYKGNNHYARVRHEKLVYEGGTYSPSQWASKIAGNTARNAWHDIWVRFPGQGAWLYTGDLRRQA